MLLFWLMACHRPDPAPEGLDASARFLLREFHSDDATVAIGLTGLLQWFDAEGNALVGQTATAETVDGFTLVDLDPSDVADLPLADDGRDLGNAHGAIGLATIACTPAAAESWLVRPDQVAVFDGDFDAYARDYLSDRTVYETSVPEPVDEPIVASNPEDRPDALLRTSNQVTISALGTTVSYGQVREFRHGTYDANGQSQPALLALTYVPEASGDDSNTVLRQNYGLELILDRGDAESLRIFAVWSHIDSPLIGVDSPIWQTNTVNQTVKSAQRMSDLCTGDAKIPDETSG